MVNYIKGGNHHKVNGIGINTHYFEIPKEEYERLEAMDKREAGEEVENSLPSDIKFGYGYYGFCLRTKKDKYYLAVKVGNTCD